jgi:molybdate transport system substrate-binding protein
MGNRTSRIAAIALAFIAFAAPAGAAEIKIVTVGAVQVALRNLAEEFGAANGHTVTLTVSGPADLERNIAADRYDAVFGASPVVTELENAGRLMPGTHKPVARSFVGIVAREGAPIPDISTVESFRTYVLGVRNMLYTDPTTPNGTGAHTWQILTDAGLLDAVRAKGRQSTLAESRELVASGEYEIAFLNLAGATSSGIVIVGAVPRELQQFTPYDMGVFADAPNRDAAAQFLDFVSSPAATPRFTDAWLEHVPE